MNVQSLSDVTRRFLKHFDIYIVYILCDINALQQPVEVCVPYHRTKRREVVVQKFDGQSWSILPTVLRRGSEGHSSHPGGRPARVTIKPPTAKRVIFKFFLS